MRAEIVLGTVTNVREAVGWLGYTYLARRLERNPQAYGVTYDQLVVDPGLDGKWTAAAAAAGCVLVCGQRVYKRMYGSRCNQPVLNTPSCGCTMQAVLYWSFRPVSLPRPLKSRSTRVTPSTPLLPHPSPLTHFAP